MAATPEQLYKRLPLGPAVVGEGRVSPPATAALALHMRAFRAAFAAPLPRLP